MITINMNRQIDVLEMYCEIKAQQKLRHHTAEKLKQLIGCSYCCC